MGNHDSDFTKTFHSPLVSGEETAVSVFCPSHFSFRQNKPIKFKISTFLTAPRSFTILGWAEIRSTIHILPKLSRALQCQERKQLHQFFSQNIYLLDETNQWNSKFPPSRQLQKNFSIKISYFLCWFRIKDKLTEQKTGAAGSCFDSEGLWKVSAKSKSWFPIQPTKKW